MAVDALVGFVGVALGAASTSILTIYKERFTARREREAREDERRRQREDQRNIFQRESILAPQSAVSDLVKSVYDEQDRMLVEMEKTNCWPARRWETPTAAGWADAEMRLEMIRVRVFDKDLSELAEQVRAHRRGRFGRRILTTPSGQISYWSSYSESSTERLESCCPACMNCSAARKFSAVGVIDE